MDGIFISRLVEGGLAESTGLLSKDDEVIEVNGIVVSIFFKKELFLLFLGERKNY